MSKYRPLQFAIFALLAILAATNLQAQSTSAPTAYSVTEVNSLFGPSVNVTIYRNGSKALIDSRRPPGDGSPQGSHTRTLYDLQTHSSYTWDLSSPGAACGTGTFSGDWGDPFAMSSEFAADAAKQNAKEVGTETINGIATRVLEATAPTAKMKVWLDPKSGLIIRAQMTPPNGQPQTIIDVKQFSLAAPPASVFTLAASCAAAAKAPRAPTRADQIHAATGDDPGNYDDAITNPPSANSCTVVFRAVQAGTMAPLTAFQAGLDLTYDQDHPASYTIGVGDRLGHSTFAGGALHEVTAQMRNGVLRIPNAPKIFYLDIEFGGGSGSTSGYIHRGCVGPQTVLLLVIKNPAKLIDGTDWLWVKSGKYATAP